MDLAIQVRGQTVKMEVLKAYVAYWFLFFIFILFRLLLLLHHLIQLFLCLNQILLSDFFAFNIVVFFEEFLFDVFVSLRHGGPFF